MFGGAPARVPSSFVQDVEDATERRAYPHHARSAVGHVPEPRYRIQDRFRQDNPNFKGYGIESTVRPDAARCPFGTNDECTDNLTPGRKGRPRGVDFAAQGIDTNTFAFGVPSQRPGTGGGMPPTSSDPCYRTTIEPMSTHRQHRPTVEPPVAGKASASATSVGALLSPGDTSIKQRAPEQERQSSRTTRPINAPSFPAGRPTSSRGRDDTNAGVSGQLFQQEKNREQMRNTLEKCGSLFNDILRNPSLFETIWARACPTADKTTVAAFRKAMEAMGV